MFVRSAPPLASPSNRVLIVDDDAGIRSLLSVVCERLGYHCDTACDGAEALEKLHLNQYALMLLDLMMPRVSGFDVVEVLRQDKERPAVVVLTARGSQGDLLDHLAVDALILKPFDVGLLTTVMLDAISERFASPRPNPATSDDADQAGPKQN